MHSCIHQRFEEQVARTPDRIALKFGHDELTYRDLDGRANQLANYLCKAGVRPDVLVGLCMERGLAMVIGLLGVLKAGGAYVPIDPQYPPERRAFMLKDSNALLILTERSCVDEFSVPGTRVLLDEDWSEIAAESSALGPRTDVDAHHLAYVIYTSGSTGTPKGTLITHRNVVRLFDATQAWFAFDERDVWTLFHSCAFDFSVWELWGALFYGGRSIIVPFGLSRTPGEFYRLIRDEGVTVLNQTPSAFRQLMRAEETASAAGELPLRYVIFGGEALDLKTLRPWFARHGDRRPRLVNMYGITETTVHVTYRPLDAHDVEAGRSVIGVPISDLQVYLLDEEREPVPLGQPGEIYVGGAGVARGYHNRPELTAQRFVPTPFPGAAAGPLYRSGDLGRYLENGELEYLGRIDQQVKIRGFRIELGEITALLDQHPQVRESVVTVFESTPGEKTLAAYLVVRPDVSVDVAALREMLRRNLPEYMVPASFNVIERIPLTVNGKLDGRALPTPLSPGTAPGGASATVSQPPGSSLERAIASIWAHVLHIGEPGLDENFFDVGGNSIHIADVHSRLQALLNRPIQMTELFQYSTVRGLARHFVTGGPVTADLEAPRTRAQRQRTALAQRRNVRLQPK